ncbi:MAG: ATPase [bacterium]
MNFNKFKKISEAPTKPYKRREQRTFDVADLYRGPVSEQSTNRAPAAQLDEKLRQAYFWIVNNAIISPYYDIEYNTSPPLTFTFGDLKSIVTLPSDQSYSSFVLLPLLTLAVRKRCLLVGGPGRGKTASAFLMGIVAGYSLKDVRGAIQHGQPHMTITDLFGTPLPKDLGPSDTMDTIRIAWRRWLGMRVKIIDEYNRIPIRTQSALLTVMADNYAEILGHIYECPESAWYLTVNNGAGGVAYKDIEALRDRIDVVVKAPHFTPRFLGELLSRVEMNCKPEEIVPPQIIFSEGELDELFKQILRVNIPYPLLRRLEFFASQFEFCEHAAEQFEYKTKDTVTLSGIDRNVVIAQDTGCDSVKNLGVQTCNGLSVRALMTILLFIKAMAYFRGDKEISLQDIREILPFILHDKLTPNHDTPFFEDAKNFVFRVDRIGWVRNLFDLACAEYNRLDLDTRDPVGEIDEELKQGLDGVSEKDAKMKLVKIERILDNWQEGRNLNGHHYDDILTLKYLHHRYSNYLKWLRFAK